MKILNIIFIAIWMLNAPSNHAIKEEHQDKTYILKNIMNDSWKDLDLKTKVFYEELLDCENIFNQAIVLLQDYLVFQALITKFENDNDEEYGIIYQVIKDQIQCMFKINQTSLSSFSLKSLPVDDANQIFMSELNKPNLSVEEFCTIINQIFSTFIPEDMKKIFNTFVSEDIKKILKKLDNINYRYITKNSKYPNIIEGRSNYRYDLIINIQDLTIRKQEEKSYVKNNAAYDKFLSERTSFVLTKKEVKEYALLRGRQEMEEKEQKSRETSITNERRFFNAATERFEKENQQKNKCTEICVKQTLPTTDIISEDIIYSVNFYKINEDYNKYKQNDLMKDCAF